MDYCSGLMRYYPQFSLKLVWDEMPLEQGWAWLNAAMSRDGWLQIAGVKMSSSGYVMQEAEKLAAIAREHHTKNGNNGNIS